LFIGGTESGSPRSVWWAVDDDNVTLCKAASVVDGSDVCSWRGGWGG